MEPWKQSLKNITKVYILTFKSEYYPIIADIALGPFSWKTPLVILIMERLMLANVINEFKVIARVKIFPEPIPGL